MTSHELSSPFCKRYKGGLTVAEDSEKNDSVDASDVVMVVLVMLVLVVVVVHQ